MRLHANLFGSPIAHASRLGKYNPMMRKDTFLHRMSYNPRSFESLSRDKSALLSVLLHRLAITNPNDGRYAGYNDQIQQVQQQLNDMKAKHAEMMAGRDSLISYVTQNAGNLVPADAIPAILTGNWSSFRRYTPPPIPSPEHEPEPMPSLGVPAGDDGILSTGPPSSSPLSSLDNEPPVSPEAAPSETSEPSVVSEPPALSEASTATHYALPAPPPSEASSIEPITPSTTSQNQEEEPQTNMPTQEEDDTNLYGILVKHKNLSNVERDELRRIRHSYPMNSPVFKANSETLSENEYEPSISNGSHATAPSFISSKSELGEPNDYNPSIKNESEYGGSHNEYEPSIYSESQKSEGPTPSFISSDESDSEITANKLQDKRREAYLAKREEEQRQIAESRMYPTLAAEFKKYTPTQLHQFVNDELGVEHQLPEWTNKISNAAHQKALRNLIEEHHKTEFIKWMRTNPGQYGNVTKQRNEGIAQRKESKAKKD